MAQPATTSGAAKAGEQAAGQLIDSLMRKLPTESRFPTMVRSASMVVSSSTESPSPDRCAGSPPQPTQPWVQVKDLPARMRMGVGGVPASPASPGRASVASVEHGRVGSVRSDATIGGMIPDLPGRFRSPTRSIPGPAQQRQQVSAWVAVASAVNASNQAHTPSPLSSVDQQQRQSEIEPAPPSPAPRGRPPEIQPVRSARASSPGNGPQGSAFSPRSVTSAQPGGVMSPTSHFRNVATRLTSEIVPRHVEPQVYAYAYGPPVSSKGPRSFAAQRRSASAPRDAAAAPRSWAAEHRAQAQDKLQQQGSKPRSYAAEKRAEAQERRSISAPPVGRSFAAIAHAAVAAQRLAGAAKSYAARRRQELSNERGSVVSGSDARSFAARRRAESTDRDEVGKSYAARRRDEARSSASPPAARSLAAERHRSASRSPSPGGQSYAARRRVEAQEQDVPRARSMAAQRHADRDVGRPKSYAAMRRTESSPREGQAHSMAAQRRKDRMGVAAAAGALVAGKSWAAKARQSRQEAMHSPERLLPAPPLVQPRLQKFMSERISPSTARAEAEAHASLRRLNTIDGPGAAAQDNAPASARDDTAKVEAEAVPMRDDTAAMKDASLRKGETLKEASLKKGLAGVAPAAPAMATAAATALEPGHKRTSTPDATGPSAPVSRHSSQMDMGGIADPFASAAAQLTVAAGVGALSSPRPSSSGAALQGSAAAVAAGGVPAGSPQKKPVRPGHKQSKSMSAALAAAAARAAAGAQPMPASPQRVQFGDMRFAGEQSPLVVLPSTMQPILVNYADVRPSRAVSPLRYSTEHITGRMRPGSPGQLHLVPGGKRQVPEPEPIIQGYVIPASRIPRLVSSARHAHGAVSQHPPYFTGPLPRSSIDDDVFPRREQAADGRWTAQVLHVQPASPSTQPMYPTGSRSGRSVFASVEGLGGQQPGTFQYPSQQLLPPTLPASKLLDAVGTYDQVMRDTIRIRAGVVDDDAASSIPSDDTVDALMIRDQHPLLALDMNRMAAATKASAAGAVKSTVRVLKDPSEAGRGIRLLRAQQLGAPAAGTDGHADAQATVTSHQQATSPGKWPGQQEAGTGQQASDLQGTAPGAAAGSNASAPEPHLVRAAGEQPVHSVRTLLPPHLPHQERHLPLLRMQSRAPTEPPEGATRLLRVNRGRVVVHPAGQDSVPTYIGGHVAGGVPPMQGEAAVFSGLQHGRGQLLGDANVVISSGGHMLKGPEGHASGPGGLASTTGASTASRTAQLLGALKAKAPGALHGALPFSIIPDVAAAMGVVPYPGEAVAGRRVDGSQMRVPVTIPGLSLNAAAAASYGTQLPLGALGALSALTALSRLSHLAGGNAFFGEDDPSSWPTLQETTPASLKLTSELLRPQRSPRQLGPSDYAHLAGMVPRVVLDYMQDGLVDRIPAAPDTAGMGLGQDQQQQQPYGARFAGAAGLPATDTPQVERDPDGPHPLTTLGFPPLPHFIPAPGYPPAHAPAPHLSAAAPQAVQGSLPVPPGVAPPISVPYQATVNASLDRPLNLTFAANLRASAETSPKHVVPSGPVLQAQGLRTPLRVRSSGAQLSMLAEEAEAQPELGVQGLHAEQQTPKKIPAPPADLTAADLPLLPQSKFRPSDVGSDLVQDEKEPSSTAGGKAGQEGKGSRGKDTEEHSKHKKKHKNKKEKDKKEAEKHSDSASSSDAPSPFPSSPDSSSSSSTDSEGSGKHKRSRKHKALKKDKEKKGSGKAAAAAVTGADGMSAAERLLSQMSEAVRESPTKHYPNDPPRHTSESGAGASGPPVAGAHPMAASPFLAMDEILHSSRIEEKARETLETWRVKRAAAAQEAAAQQQAAQLRAAKPEPSASAPSGVPTAAAAQDAHTAVHISSTAAPAATAPVPGVMPAEELQLQLSMALVNALTASKAGVDGALPTSAHAGGVPIQIFCTNLNLPQQPQAVAQPAAAQPVGSAGPMLVVDNTAGSASTCGSDEGPGARRASGSPPAVPSPHTAETAQAGVQRLQPAVPHAGVRSTESQTLESTLQPQLAQPHVSEFARPGAAAAVLQAQCAGPDPDVGAEGGAPPAYQPQAAPSTSPAPSPAPNTPEAMALELTSLIMKVFSDSHGVVGVEEDDGQRPSVGTSSGGSAADGQFFLTSLYSTSSGQPTLNRLQPQAQGVSSGSAGAVVAPPALALASSYSSGSTEGMAPAPAPQPPSAPPAFLAVMEQGPTVGAMPGMLPNPSVPRGASAPGFLQVMDIVPVEPQAPAAPPQAPAGSQQQGPGYAVQHRLEHMRQRMQWQIAQVVQQLPSPRQTSPAPSPMPTLGQQGPPSQYYPPAPVKGYMGPAAPSTQGYSASLYTGSSAASYGSVPHSTHGPVATLAPTLAPSTQQVAMQVVARLPPTTVRHTGTAAPLPSYPPVPSLRWDALQQTQAAGGGANHTTFTFQAAPGAQVGTQAGSPAAGYSSPGRQAGSPHSMSPPRSGSYVQLLTAGGPGAITGGGILAHQQPLQRQPHAQAGGRSEVVEAPQQRPAPAPPSAVDARVEQRDENRRMLLNAWATEMRDISSAVTRAEVSNQAVRMAAQHAADQRAAAREAQVGGLLDALADVDKIAREIEEEAHDTRRMMQELEEWNALSGAREFNRLMVEARHLGDAVESLLTDQGHVPGMPGSSPPLPSFQPQQGSTAAGASSTTAAGNAAAAGSRVGGGQGAVAAAGAQLPSTPNVGTVPAAAPQRTYSLDDDEGAKPWTSPDRDRR